ncbi:MAG: helicase-associated domain-containing protein [Anaerolineales bacterium]|nr:helicase-associated domain-containing protein [Anaerolineales bacterium]
MTRDLFVTLHAQDLGYYRIVAELWGLELESVEPAAALEELCAALLDLETIAETLSILPAQARAALDELLAADGKIEWGAFSRKYGIIREMGAGKRDRERPYLKPASVSEFLFYRALLAQAFFETDKGAQEFAYIPEDLLEALRELNLGADAPPARADEALGRSATPLEKAFEIPANDFILDDATTCIAALRIGQKVDLRFERELFALLGVAGIVKDGGVYPDAAKKFLESSRAEALTWLYESWKASSSFDELRLMPEIVCEGEWQNQPQTTREFLLDLLSAIPQGKWQSLSAFVRGVKEKYPDYQRAAGDYDSWFVKRAADGEYLRGFAYWDAVDGTLIKYLIRILHWLGRADLAAPSEGKDISAFRLVEPRSELPQAEKIYVASNGKIVVSRWFSRAARYQLARFCEWDEAKGDDYVYRISAASLTRAAKQGLKAEQLLTMLVKYAKDAVPPPTVKALKRWNANGVEARMENLLVLRFAKPEALDEARKSKAAKYFGELLSPTTVIVKSGAARQALAELAELGLLAEVKE